MKYLDEYRDAESAKKLADAIARVTTRPWTIMEVCGGPTHTIRKYRIDEILPRGGGAHPPPHAVGRLGAPPPARCTPTATGCPGWWRRPRCPPPPGPPQPGCGVPGAGDPPPGSGPPGSASRSPAGTACPSSSR